MYEQAPANWQKWEHKYDGQINTTEDAVKFANEMIGSLKDPFTRLYSPAETAAMEQRMSGKFSGIGIGLDVEIDAATGQPVLSPDKKPMPKADANGYPLVARVFEGGPSDVAGLKAGDALVSADGIDFKGKSLDVVVGAVKNGKSGTTVKLIVSRDGANLSIDVVRGVISSPAVTVKTFGKVGYIRLESFEQDDTVDEMKAALKSLSGSEKLVIDLRGNPGGRVGICFDLVSLFLPEGTVVSIRSRIPDAPSRSSSDVPGVPPTAGSQEESKSAGESVRAS
jgi:carboxyl-terminal processing protease